MKKILTFLVMLFVSVSILSAQDQQVPQAKFNYQAVVRDQNHDFNLVMEKPVTVTIEIVQINNTTADAPGYYEYREVTTNRNGMVSFVIGSEEDGVEFNGDLSEIDWTNALIRATFTDAEGETLSVVENVVMPVPLALQSVQDPLEITTTKIVEYLNSENTTGEDVGQIVTALFNKAEVSKAVKDSIVSYIKSEPATVKDLALYFIANASVQDAKDAYNAVTPAVKQKLKQMLVDSIKANKKLAYEIAQYYLTNTTKDEVQGLWSAARQNSQFHEIFNAVRDSAIAYVMNHKELVMTVAEYYIKNVLTYQDVREIYDTLRDKNPALYTQLKNKFDSYLESYIGDTYVKACDGITVCDLKEELENAKAKAAGCPYFIEGDNQTLSATAGTPNTYRAFVAGSNLDEIKTILTVNNNDGKVFPALNLQWTAPSTAANLYEGSEQSTTLTAGQVVVFKLVKSGCPTVEKSVVVTAQ